MVSALICRISTLSALNSSSFARNPLTWFCQPPVKANGRKDTTVRRPLYFASDKVSPVCAASVNSGAAVPACSAVIHVLLFGPKLDKPRTIGCAQIFIPNLLIVYVASLQRTQSGGQLNPKSIEVLHQFRLFIS